ncbi:hypothetical protein AVEN_62027-1 [Araneus ventricosus]|uniref:Uncharacterized protein n=1 Tax=Araneus ventricosus TaxID=182803 RepID=A0A4Y2W9P8_ARAVE|nr:hypothetical protein AVEN_62027-1 [Araneus ventricosus]
MPICDGPYFILGQKSPSSSIIASLGKTSEPIAWYHTSALAPFKDISKYLAEKERSITKSCCSTADHKWKNFMCILVPQIVAETMATVLSTEPVSNALVGSLSLERYVKKLIDWGLKKYSDVPVISRAIRIANRSVSTPITATNMALEPPEIEDSNSSPTSFALSQFFLSAATKPLAGLINKCLGQLTLRVLGSSSRLDNFTKSESSRDCLEGRNSTCRSEDTKLFSEKSANTSDTFMFIGREETHLDKVESAIHRPCVTPPAIFMYLIGHSSIIMSGANPLHNLSFYCEVRSILIKKIGGNSLV